MTSSAARSSRPILCSLLVAGALAIGVGTAAAAPSPPLMAAAAATFVDLGAAESYSVLAGTSVANTGSGTVLAGDLGLSPAGPITGFPPGTVNGTIHDEDAAAETAQSDRADAYADAAGQQTTTTFAGDQAGVTFRPGVHTTAAAFSNTGTMTLDADGDPNAVFVFQIDAALSSAAGSKVVLTDGALANNVYWQVAGAISLGADARYVGTFLGAGAITLGDGASLKGRALTPTSVALTNNPFLVAKDDLTAPLVTIDGGAARSTNDPTPTISGTTDEPAGSVRVTVGGQTLTAAVGAGGTWAVSSTALASGTHAVVATITDPSQNVGTARQELTVDQTAPVISIDGPATRSTNDTTPAISGTTDAAPGAPVTVTVDGQTLTTEAGGGTGAWTVTTGTLAEEVHSAVASVEDGAGNRATATQVLVVDLTAPVVTINGGASRSTSDTSPWTYGTTAEKAGTTVHVSIGDQELTATVEAGGSWGASASTLPTGTYEVVASVTDAAQNTGTAVQTLTISVPGPGDPACSGLVATIYAGSGTINGTPGDDVIVGSSGGDTINGRGGNDTICAGAGDDTVLQGAGPDGADHVNGQAGTDTISYASRTAAVAVTLAGSGTSDDGAAGEADNIFGIENAIGGTASDILTGNALANTLNGGGGNDTLNGNTGNDTELGGNGDDRFVQGAASNGADALTGQAGTDTVTYASRTAVVTLTLAISAAGNDGATDEADNLNGVENATGGKGSDALTGSGTSNVLDGGDGNDTLRLRDNVSGNDTGNGGSGTDTATFDVGDTVTNVP